jgi:electron transfer flavoprotein alpha subunit
MAAQNTPHPVQQIGTKPLPPLLKSLIVTEYDGRTIKQSSLSAIALARALGSPYELLVLGSGVSQAAELVRGYGADVVWVADNPALLEPLADRYAAVMASAVRMTRANTLLGTASTFSKDILPRAAALLDAPMVSDVTAVEIKDGDVVYHRPWSAGRFCETLLLEGPGIQVLTARGTAFHPPTPGDVLCPVERIDVDTAALPERMRFISREHRLSTRPDLTEARVVVSGGRPLRDRATFEKLVGGLADALGGAVGATRAAVDGGMAPNDWQVGQTGKSVAPVLYVAVGISGAIQHVAGIMDSKVIVAINRDPEAPIFQVANYGIVGDLHEIVPRLIAAVPSST